MSEGELEVRVRRCEESLRGAREVGGGAEFELVKAYDALGRDADFWTALGKALARSRDRGLHREVLRFALERATRIGAVEDFTRRYGSEFRSPEEKLLLIEEELSRGRTERALILLDRESRAPNATREILFRHAKVALEAGRARESLPSLLRLVDGDPFDEDGWELALVASEQTGRRDVLVDRLTLAVRRSRDYDELERLRGTIERFSDERALAAFEERLEAFSTRDPRAYLAHLGRLFDGSREFDLDAKLAVAERFVTARGEFASEVGALLLDHERVTLGLEWLRKGAKATPAARRALALGLERAASLEEKKARSYRGEAAATWREIAFDRARGTPSARGEARRRLVTLRAKEKRLPEELSALAARGPRGTFVLEDLLYEAEVFEALGEFVKAEETLAAVREKFGNEVLGISASVEFYERRKRPEMVARFLRAWGEIEPTRRGTLRTRLVGALEATGGKAAALAEVRDGLAASPDDLPLLSRFEKLASGEEERKLFTAAVEAAIARRGPEPELVLLLLGASPEAPEQKATEAFRLACARARRPEQMTPLLSVAERSGKVGNETVARETLSALARFPEDRELELFSLGYFGRVERSPLSLSTRDRIDYRLLSELGRKDRASSRREVLTLLERNPPRAHAHLLLSFLRSPPDRELVPRVWSLLRRQDAIPVSEAESLLLETDSSVLRHGLALELARRHQRPSSRLLAFAAGSSDPVLVVYVVLGLEPSAAPSFVRRLPERLVLNPVVGAALALSGLGAHDHGRGSSSALAGAFLSYRTALREAAGGTVGRARLSALLSSNRLERGALQQALLGTTPLELRSAILELATDEPSRPERSFEATLTRAEEAGWRRVLWAKAFSSTLELVREGLAGEAPTAERALGLLSALDPSLVSAESRGRAQLDGLLAALEGVLGRGGEFPSLAIRLFPLFRDALSVEAVQARDAFVRRALELGGAPGLAMRSELESWGSERAVELLVESFGNRANWVERRRDLRSLGHLARSGEASGSSASRSFLGRIAREDQGLASEEAAALLSSGR